MPPFHAIEAPGIVKDCLDDSGVVTSSRFATRAGVSRQTAHAHLTRLVERGLLVRDGKGRGTHYRARPIASASLPFPAPFQARAPAFEPVESLWIALHARVPRPTRREEVAVALEGADHARRVLLDFADVDEVGTAFAQALFHEWAPAHPGVRLEVVNTRPAVRRFLAHVRSPSGRSI